MELMIDQEISLNNLIYVIASLLLKSCLTILSLQVWFQNRRAKWKKQRKSNSLLHSPSPLLPSHSLPPLGVSSISSFSSSWAPNGYSGPDSDINTQYSVTLKLNTQASVS